jgi:hypothetical protein
MTGIHPVEITSGILGGNLPGSLEQSRAALPISSLRKAAIGAHEHPFSCTLLEEIHINKLNANVFSIRDPLFGDSAMAYGNIAEHLHIDRSEFMRHEFVLAGFNRLQNALLSDDLARGSDDFEIVRVDPIELLNIDVHGRVPDFLLDLLDSG